MREKEQNVVVDEQNYGIIVLGTNRLLYELWN